MPYSVEILVIEQESLLDYPFDNALKLEREGGRLGDLRLRKNWPVMSSVPGLWYNIVKKNEIYFENTSLIYKTDFDHAINQDKYYWIIDEDRKDNFTPFIVQEDYLNDFKQILEFLIKQSPIGTIMVLPLYEKGKIEVIQGPISFKKYFELLDQERIPFNVCTIVQNDS